MVSPVYVTWTDGKRERADHGRVVDRDVQSDVSVWISRDEVVEHRPVMSSSLSRYYLNTTDSGRRAYVAIRAFSHPARTAR